MADEEYLALQRTAGNRAVGELLDRSDSGRSDSRPAADALPLISDELRSPGEPLDGSTRRFMEAAYGEPFDRVRVHTSAQAAHSADSMDARAYTVGDDVVFAAHEYVPNDSDGIHLLAHELAHVIHQRRAAGATFGSLAVPGAAAFESDAERAATHVVSGFTPQVAATGTPPAVQASGKGKKKGKSRRKREPKPPNLDDPGQRGTLTERAAFDVEVRPVLEKKGYAVYYKNSFPKELREVFPDMRARPEFVAIHKKSGKIVVGDVTATPATGTALKPGDVRKLPHGTTTDIETKHHLEKTVDYAQQLKRSGKYPDAEIVAQDWYSEDPDVRRSKEVTVQKPRVKTGQGAPSAGRRTGKGEEDGPSQRKGAPSKRTRTKPSLRRPAPNKGSPSKGPGRSRRPEGTALKGSLRSLGLQFGLGLLQDEFQEMMLEDLAKLPQPKIDERGAEEYLQDPDVAKSMKLVDLFNKELGPFQTKLEEHHTSTTWGAAGEAMQALEVDDLAERLDWLGEIQEQLSDYGRDLDTVSDNIDALLELEEKALESADAADALVKLMYGPFVGDYIIRAVGVEGFSRAESSLRYHSASIRKLFRDARKLRSSLDDMMEKRSALEDTIADFQGEAFGKLLKERIEQQKTEREQAEQTEVEEAKPEPAEEAEKEAPKPRPRRQASSKPMQQEVVKPDLWKRARSALGRARRFRSDPQGAEGTADAIMQELWALIGEIDRRRIEGFAHEEEKDVFLKLSTELWKEVGAYMDAKSRGDF